MNERFSPPLQYAKTSDGVNIAFMVFGEGPAIVCASNIFGEAHDYRTLAWHHGRGVTDGLVARGWQVVRYDVRGMGSSDRPPVDWSLEARAKDLEAVTDRLSLERFTLAALDLGAATAVAYTVRHPQRVHRLVLVSPWVSGAEMFDLPHLRVAARAMTDGEREWQVFTTVLANIATTFEDPERARDLAESMRTATTAEGLAEYFRTSAKIDLSDYIHKLRVPTLIIHQPTFPFGSLELCQQVAKGIAGSQFIVVGDKSLAGTEHERMVQAIDAFLRNGRVASSPASIAAPSPRPRPTVAVLTNRETDVLARIATGLTTKEIAKELDISVATVDRHLANLYAKIGARGRVDAALYALRHGYTTTAR